MTSTPDIPNYKILEIAGEGGMGVVYRAEHVVTKRVVALKMLTAVDKPDAAEQFLQEGRTIAGLEHPHILPIYDLGREGNSQRPYIAMRYVEGGSVADKLRERGKIEPEMAARWLGNIADALDLAHERGIVHKDVKPSNILMDSKHNVYLTDFGIAGMSGGEEGNFAGSAAYMAPEQGQGLITDGRADIYALSVTLFELLTGEKPYLAETGLGVIVRHINDPIPDPRGVNSGLSLALADLVMWGMSKDAADRPQTAAQFGLALQQALQRPEERVRPIESPRKQEASVDLPDVARPVATGRTSLVWGGIVGLILLIAIVLFGFDPLGLFASEPTATLRAEVGQPTVVVLPTSAPSPTPAGQLFFNDFNAERVSSGDQDDAVALVGDALLFDTTDNSGYATFNTGELHVQDVMIQVDLLPSERASEYELLLSCRWLDAGNYTAALLQTTPEMQLAVMIQLIDGQTTILSRAELPVGLLAGEHQLNINCQGENLELFVDGVSVLAGEDLAPQQGDVALMTRPLQENQQQIVAFDNLLVMK